MLTREKTRIFDALETLMNVPLILTRSTSKECHAILLETIDPVKRFYQYLEDLEDCIMKRIACLEPDKKQIILTTLAIRRNPKVIAMLNAAGRMPHKLMMLTMYGEAMQIWREDLANLNKVVEEAENALKQLRLQYQEWRNCISHKPSDGDCAVCLESSVIRAKLVPCGHEETCTACTVRIHRETSKCPMCRADFDDVM